MDSVTPPGPIVRRVIEAYASVAASAKGPGQVRSELVIDEAKGHYELMQSGWVGIHRVHGSVLHIDILDGKVWIEHDGTEDGVAEELVAAGIPRDRIVLGFQHPEARPYTDYATA